MPCKVQIYSPKGSSALSFVLDFVFDEFYGCEYEIVTEVNALDPSGVVINYSEEEIADAIQIVPNGYLFLSDLRVFPEVELSEWDDLPVFFETNGSIPFDLFGAIFFLLARVEELTNAKRDVHNRFSASFSIFQTDFIQRPIIDEWLLKLKSNFLENVGLAFAERQFKWINTYDIDVAYAYRFRRKKHVVAAAGRNVLRGDFKSFFTRFEVLLGGKKDPYDTYDFQKQISENYADETIYFFLLGDRSKYDRNLSYINSGMKSLIQSCEQFAGIGIHPSYLSGEKPGQLAVEINRLSNIASKEVIASRQHFLRLTVPSTYRDLIDCGITQDYSMGYADMPGFRSGTCTPHYFFDVDKNTKTKLRIFPLMIMEASLRDYLKLNLSEGQAMINLLMDRVKAVKGHFITLWHNDSLSEANGNYWRDLYLDMAKSLKQK